jgi:signal transduction histidine kinase
MPARTLRRLRPHADAILAAALVGLMVVQVTTLHLSARTTALAVAAGVALLVPLALRCERPLLLLGVLVAGGAVGQALPKRVLDVEAFGLIVLLSMYSVGAHTRGRRAVVGALGIAVFAAGVLVTDPDGVYLGGVLFIVFSFGGPWLAGFVVRRRRDNEAQLERERDEAEAAIADERARIARELHDVVAHAISVIVLQARGGRRMLASEPDETRTALDAIEHTGQQALVEMRRLVGLLRECDDQLALTPQPTLSHLGRLAESVRGAGLPVDVVIEGDAVELAPGVDLSAYRIVQEALTNALKHAGPARARVTLRYGTEALDLEIVDDGRGRTNGSVRGGHGLVGVRERVSVVGGALLVGPREDGGYAVRAHLPYRGVR